MSYTFTFTGTSSELSAEFNPPIFLNPSREYVMGLTNFECFHSIPNITSGNNAVKVGEKIIRLPEGSYEVSDIGAYINSQLLDDQYVRIRADRKTLKTTIKSNVEVNFNVPSSIGPVLGFTKRKLDVNVIHYSDSTTQIVKINSLLIDCNITTGNYKNGAAAHTIYQFFPSVPPGYKIIEAPLHILYLPISVTTISKITLKILDQDGDLVNFREETITVGLHLKELRNGFPL